MDKVKVSGGSGYFNDCLSLKFGKIYQGFKTETKSFWFLCVYFFLEYTRIQQIYDWLGIIPWAQIFLLAAFFSIIISSSKIKIKFGAFGFSFAVFFVHIMLSSVFGHDVNRSFQQVPVIVNWLLMYFCVVNLVTTKERFFILLSVIMLASFKMSQHAAISWAGRGFAFSRWGIAGAPGWFGDAADLGLQMCIFLAFTFFFYLLVRGRISLFPRIILYLMMLTALATILAAGNRGTLLALFAMALSYLVMRKKRIRNLIGLIVFFAILLSLAPKEFLQRFDTAGEDNTSTERLELWGNGINMGKKHPGLGVGYENFTSYNGDYFGKAKVAHNTPITVFAELGYIGLIIYMYLFLKVVWVNFRLIGRSRKNKDDFTQSMAAAMIIGMSAYIVSTLFITVPYYPYLYVQMALTAALLRISVND
ncbi:O-antigen ligase family protein [Dasania marina]|uniref:O-antigen ligase family protein n=1 Tax=Dasania marina TaxID=471499 RepID=UPI00038231F9|nr:O-antigen ligase family protein [Dasania marina]